MLLVSLLAASLLGALAGGVVLTALTETAIAARHREGVALFYAADGAAEQQVAALAATADWSPWLSTSWQTTMAASARQLLGPAAPVAQLVVRVAASADTAGALVVRASARGASGAERAVEVSVERGGGGARVLSWRELR